MIHRAEYPATQSQTYLNTASCGLISRATAAAAQQVYQQHLRHGGTPRAQWYAQIATTRQLAAEWLGAQANEIAFVSNFTSGMNVVVPMLRSFGTVLLLEGDYPSLTLPWQLHGHRVVTCPTEANGAFALEQVEQYIRQHQINIVAVSHVQYTTGFCVDLVALSKLCLAYEVLLVVDATQSMGVVPIDVKKTPVDVLVASGYKWMTAGFGNGLLYMRQELQARLRLVVMGSNSFEEAIPEGEILFSIRTLEAGHYHYSGLLALQQALQELRAIGSSTVGEQVKELTHYLYERLPPSVRVVSDYAPEHRSGITVIAGDKRLEQFLLGEGIVTTAKAKGVRISLHFYNNREDVDHLCRCLVTYTES